jgi:5-methylcytosine-specific restriction enzyme subunit McrC
LRAPDPPVIQMREWDTRVLPDILLSSKDQQLVERLNREEYSRVSVDVLRSGVRLTSRAWVGVVRFESFELRITPKLDGGNRTVARLIDYVSGLGGIRRIRAERNLATDGANLVDLLALILSEECEQIIRNGMIQDYLELEDDLPVLRGRFLTDRQIRHRLGRLDRLECRFDERDQNVVENQILEAALRLTSRVTSSPTISACLQRTWQIFREVCNADTMDLDDARARVVYGRLNSHYRSAHELAWLLLDGIGVEDLFATGPVRCFAFLVDMNRIFELFVYRVASHWIGEAGGKVSYQPRMPARIVDAVTGQTYKELKPDLLVTFPGGERVPVDAKYKLYDDRKLDNSDIYQVFCYAYSLGEGHADLARAILLYPTPGPSLRSTQLRIRGDGAHEGAIDVLGVPILPILDDVEQGKRGPATLALRDVLCQRVPQPPLRRSA